MLEITIDCTVSFEGKVRYHIRQQNNDFELTYAKTSFRKGQELSTQHISAEVMQPLIDKLFKHKLPCRESQLLGLDGVMYSVTINRNNRSRTYSWWGAGDDNYRQLMRFVKRVEVLVIDR